MDWTTWGFVYNYVFWLVSSFHSLFSLGQNIGGHFDMCVSGHTFPLASGSKMTLHDPVLLSHPQAWAHTMLCNVFSLGPFHTNEKNLLSPLVPCPASSSLNSCVLVPPSAVKVKQERLQHWSPRCVPISLSESAISFWSPYLSLNYLFLDTLWATTMCLKERRCMKPHIFKMMKLKSREMWLL